MNLQDVRTLGYVRTRLCMTSTYCACAYMWDNTCSMLAGTIKFCGAVRFLASGIVQMPHHKLDCLDCPQESIGCSPAAEMQPKFCETQDMLTLYALPQGGLHELGNQSV